MIIDCRKEIENNIREMKRDYKRMRVADILVLVMAVMVIVMCGSFMVYHFSEGRFVGGMIFVALIVLNVRSSVRLIRSMIRCDKSYKNMICCYEELLRDMGELEEKNETVVGGGRTG